MEELERTIKGGQSALRVTINNNLANQPILEKKFNFPQDYQREKKFYTQIINKIESQDEVQFLKLLDFDDTNTTLTFPFINGGNLWAQITQEKGIQDLQKLMNSFLKVVEIIKFLHQNNICHCDIKPENVIIKGVDISSPHILIDFGHFQEFQKNKKSTMRCGTLQYNPPKLNKEIFSPYGKIEEYCPKKLDLYQLGIFLLMMKAPIIMGDDIKKIAQKYSRLQMFKDNVQRIYQNQQEKKLVWSDDLVDLIVQILSEQITSIEQIYEHKLVQQYLQNNEQKEFNYQIIQQFQINKQDNSNRSNGTSTQFSIDKAFQNYQKLMKDYLEDQKEYIELQNRFFKNQARKIEKYELNGDSLLAEMSAEDLLKILLNILAENNNEIFQQDIFKGKDNLTLEAELIYQEAQLACKNNLKNNLEELLQQCDSEEEIEDLYQSIELIQVNKKLKMQIEIVSVQKEEKEMRSLIFNLIDGSYLPFINLVQQIKNKISQI